MLAKDDDWLTAGNQLDDSLLMDDLWDDDAAPQDDKSAASHSTGSTFPQDNAETLPQKSDGTGSSSNVPTVPQSNRESIPGENANTFPQYFDDSFPQSDESTTHQSDSNPFQQEDVDPFQQEYNQLSTQEKEESFSRSNDSTVSRSNSASLSQEDAETIPHSTEHTVPQSDKTTDSQDSKGTASRPIRTTAPQNTVDPVQQDTADTTPQENAENPDQIDLLANGYDPFKEFIDSAEDHNDKKSEEQSAVSAFPQNNEETQEQGKGPEEYDPFEQFDVVEIIPDISDIVQRNPEFPAQSSGHGELVRYALKQIIDFQFVSTPFDDAGNFPRNDSDRNSGTMGKQNSGAVVRMKFLPFVTRLVVIHSSVRPHTVDIGKNQFNLIHFSLYFYRIGTTRDRESVSCERNRAHEIISAYIISSAGISRIAVCPTTRSRSAHL